MMHCIVLYCIVLYCIVSIHLYLRFLQCTPIRSASSARDPERREQSWENEIKDVIPCLVLRCHSLPCPIMLCLIILFLALSYVAIPCLVLRCHSLPCLIIP